MASGVRLRVRADDTGVERVIAVDGAAFIARFMQHVLPARLKRILDYGLLAPAARTQRLALARSLSARPAVSAHARANEQAFMRRVAAIDIGRWQLVQALPADRVALASIPPTACQDHHEVLHSFDATERGALRMPACACSRPARASRVVGPVAGTSRRARERSTSAVCALAALAAASRIRQHCPRQRLKLALPIPPPPRRFSSTRFI
jgi:hypothetical protein